LSFPLLSWPLVLESQTKTSCTSFNNDHKENQYPEVPSACAVVVTKSLEIACKTGHFVSACHFYVWCIQWVVSKHFFEQNFQGIILTSIRVHLWNWHYDYYYYASCGTMLVTMSAQACNSHIFIQLHHVLLHGECLPDPT